MFLYLQIESRGATVLFHIRSILTEMVEEEEALRDRMLKETEQLSQQVTDLCENLQLAPYSHPDGLITIRQKRNAYR